MRANSTEEWNKHWALSKWYQLKLSQFHEKWRLDLLYLPDTVVRIKLIKALYKPKMGIAVFEGSKLQAYSYKLQDSDSYKIIMNQNVIIYSDY